MYTHNYNEAYNLITEEQQGLWTTASVARSLVGRGILPKSSPISNYVYIHVNGRGDASVEAVSNTFHRGMKA